MIPERTPGRTTTTDNTPRNNPLGISILHLLNLENCLGNIGNFMKITQLYTYVSKAVARLGQRRAFVEKGQGAFLNVLFRFYKTISLYSVLICNVCSTFRHLGNTKVSNNWDR